MAQTRNPESDTKTSVRGILFPKQEILYPKWEISYEKEIELNLSGYEIYYTKYLILLVKSEVNCIAIKVLV